MRRRNHKSFILYLLALICAGGSCLSVIGCRDNPEAKDAKEMRQQTADVVRKSISEKDFSSTQDKVDALRDDQKKIMALLEQNQSRGLTKDAALLASGNLALAQGQQLQSDLGLKTLPLRKSTDKLQKILRDSERLLIEKEKVETLLDSGDREIVGLQQLLDGDDPKEGLKKQLEVASAELAKLQSEKESVQAEKDQTQAILDEYQSNADDLMRQAELAKGDQRLDLEKQAFAILQQRKEHYIKVQSAEDRVALLDSDISLVQVRVDGLARSLQDIQKRIESINTSQTRTALKEQMREIKEDINGNQKQLSELAGEIAAGLTAYRKMSDEICAVYDDAIAEFAEINSRDIEFTATVRLADSAHYAALTCSAFIRTQEYLSEGLRMLLDTADPEFVSAIQSKLPQQGIGTGYTEKTFAYFDRSIESYEMGLSMVTRLSRDLKQKDRTKIRDAKCSLMKSQVLALHSKMQLADLLEKFDLATKTETAMDELIEKATELGVCFTQSETIRIVKSEGLDYLPSLPLNIEVFIDGKKQELSAWKRLPIDEQEAAVDDNIQEIDNLIAQYGQEVARQLEPLKQEMLDAKKRGFEEPAPDSDSGEPNSLY